jgi:hypothetical protein
MILLMLSEWVDCRAEEATELSKELEAGSIGMWSGWMQGGEVRDTYMIVV